MHADIEQFLVQEHILTLASCNKNIPWVCSLFYLYTKSNGTPGFLFATEPTTRHGLHLQSNPVVAANIYKPTRVVNEIKGIQCQGKAETLTTNHVVEKQAYMNAFPYSKKLTSFTLWKMSIEFAKLTDNTIHFGYKKIWTK